MINVGIIGLGNVGQGVVSILHENHAMIETRVGEPIHIKTVVVRDIEKYKDVKIGTAQLTTDVNDVINDPEITIVVELIGGETPAYDIICESLKNGKYVVTANKEVVSKHKKTFFELAKANNVDIYFEAAVAGGIPIIRSLKVGFSANRIDTIYGILNGTTNYILSKIEEDQAEFEDVLKTAQELGLAEADPAMDIEGTDAAHKLVILAAVAFKSDIQLESLYYEGIKSITLSDIQYAKQLGYSIKLLAIGRRFPDSRLSFKVHPTMVPLDHPLAAIRNENNAVYIVGNAVGEVLLSGKGAGGAPTGSAVVSDIIDIAFDYTKKINRRNLETDLQPAELVNIEETESQFYFRLQTVDQPHVLENVTGTFSQHGISISKILQKEAFQNQAEIVIVTHRSQESVIQDVKSQLEALDDVTEVSSLIRVRLDELT